MSKLKDKFTFITGAASGNGKGIAQVFAKHGAHVLLADISDQVFETAKEISSQGYSATGYKMDVTDMKDVQKTVDTALGQFGRIDALVNNAGVIRLLNFLDMSDEIRDFHFNVNINGMWNVTKAILPTMVQNKYGKIVNISSVTGIMVADEGETAYATSKAAIIGFTKSLAREVARYKINVNAICPGIIHTPMVQKMAEQSNESNPQAVIDEISSSIPLGKLGEIEDIGELAAFLASHESSYLTGTQVVIDGGSTLPETISLGL